MFTEFQTDMISSSYLPTSNNWNTPFIVSEDQWERFLARLKAEFGFDLFNCLGTIRFEKYISGQRLVVLSVPGETGKILLDGRRDVALWLLQDEVIPDALEVRVDMRHSVRKTRGPVDLGIDLRRKPTMPVKKAEPQPDDKAKKRKVLTPPMMEMDQFFLPAAEVLPQEFDISILDIIDISQLRPKIEQVQIAVSRHFDVSRALLVSNKRTRAIVEPRQIGMFLSKSLTHRSFPEIGRAFGGRDHTTALHAVNKIEELRHTDKELQALIDKLTRDILFLAAKRQHRLGVPFKGFYPIEERAAA